MRVHAVPECYGVTQTAYTQALEERGYRGEEIGTYAGLADKSLMLAIDPTLVRVDALRNGAKPIGFIPTGVGTHGLYPSRDGRKLYVANRGSDKVNGPPRGQGSVSVIDFATRQVESTWPVPGGGSPDMGNVSADGKYLWLSGRFDRAVYAFDTGTGSVQTIAVGKEPHGLTVWPQPGRYSLGHTGNLR